jgi:hypothetical protein
MWYSKIYYPALSQFATNGAPVLGNRGGAGGGVADREADGNDTMTELLNALLLLLLAAMTGILWRNKDRG